MIYNNFKIISCDTIYKNRKEFNKIVINYNGNKKFSILTRNCLNFKDIKNDRNFKLMVLNIVQLYEIISENYTKNLSIQVNKKGHTFINFKENDHINECITPENLKNKYLDLKKSCHNSAKKKEQQKKIDAIVQYNKGMDECFKKIEPIKKSTKDKDITHSHSKSPSKNTNVEVESNKKLEIFHLGGTHNPAFDPTNIGRELHYKKHYYERVPIQTKNGEVHVYHHLLQKYTDKWIKETKSEETDLNFQDWMAINYEDDGTLQDAKSNQVRYFNNKERKQTRVTVHNGSLKQIGLDAKDKKKKDLKPGSYAYVLGDFIVPKKEKGKIEPQIITKFYATIKGPTEKGNIQHSSFLRGGNVKSAGMFEVNDKGMITSLRNQSGHYLPTTKEIAYVVDYLQKSGYDISTFNVTYPKNVIARMLNLSLLAVNKRADIWFEKKGKKLLAL